MNIPFDLRQLRYFLALCEARNFGRAATKLHISQPPLSRQIRQLEDQLGVALFERNSTGVTLTAAGKAFLPEVKRTLEQAERAAAVVRTARETQSSHFVAGYTTVFDRSVIPDLAAAFRQRLPAWQLTFKGQHSVNLVRSVLNGTMDIAFVGLHTETRGLKTEPLFQEALVAALPEGHALAKKRELTVADLTTQTLFWFERRLNPGYYDYCQKVFARIDFRPQTLPEPHDHHLMLGMIAENEGMALIPASLQNVQRKGVVFRELSEEFSTLTSGLAVIYSPDNRSAALPLILEAILPG